MAALSILVVEDDRGIRESLARYLVDNQFKVTQAADAAEARDRLAYGVFDLVIADIMMPGESGLSLCRHIREVRDIPVILLTARAEAADRIIGLEMGADDYVTKPFNPRELLARIKVIIRRAKAAPRSDGSGAAHRLAFGDWVLKTGERELLRADGVVVSLSSREYALLVALAERPRRVLTREQLLDFTRGQQGEVFDRSVDNQICRLRKKIEPNEGEPTYIKTVWGGGYIFTAAVRRV